MNLRMLRQPFQQAAIIALITFVLLEIVVRAYFALKVGPDVLVYGTPYCCGTNLDLKIKDSATTKRAREDPPPIVEHHEGYTKYHPYQERYDIDKNEESFKVTINRHGFRGKDFEIEKADGVIRIVTLGASSTFGFFDRDQHTYPVMLERKLNEELATGVRCRKGDRFEVINLGIPHLTTDNILSLYRAEGRLMRPDVVTFYEGINDAAWTFGQLQWDKYPIYYRAIMKLKKWFIVFGLFESLVDVGKPRFDSSDLEHFIGAKPTHFIDNLRKIREMALRDDALFIVATQQAKASRYPREAIHGVTYEREVAEAVRELETVGHIDRWSLILVTHSRLMNALRDWASAESVPLVDGIAALNENQDVLASWVHLLPDGNEMLSDALSKTILALNCTR